MNRSGHSVEKLTQGTLVSLCRYSEERVTFAGGFLGLLGLRTSVRNGRSYFRLTPQHQTTVFRLFLKLFAPPITFFDERRGFISALFMFPTCVGARKFSRTICAAENSYLLRSNLM